MGESKSQEGVRTCEGDVEVKDTRAERKDQSRVSDWEYKPKRSKREKIQGPEMRIKSGGRFEYRSCRSIQWFLYILR